LRFVDCGLKAETVNIAQRVIRRVVGRRFEQAYEPEFLSIWRQCETFTLTSVQRAYGLWLACRYVVQARILGDFIECGTYRGGSAMVMALSLLSLGEERDIYLYDTFEGMPEPSESDVSAYEDTDARTSWKSKPATDTWMCVASVDEVRSNLASTGYPVNRVHLVKGMVEDTLPISAHEHIAMLRLDTDWHASTKLELETLYPSLRPGGVLIVDDYGHWQGAAKAVDEYFGGAILLSPLDYTGRIAVKA
jgi:hypothetical protein